MKEQKVLVTGDQGSHEVQAKVDALLVEGWQIVSVTAQHVSTGSSQFFRGGYFIVFERAAAE